VASYILKNLAVSMRDTEEVPEPSLLRWSVVLYYAWKKQFYAKQEILSECRAVLPDERVAVSVMRNTLLDDVIVRQVRNCVFKSCTPPLAPLFKVVKADKEKIVLYSFACRSEFFQKLQATFVPPAVEKPLATQTSFTFVSQAKTLFKTMFPTDDPLDVKKLHVFSTTRLMRLRPSAMSKNACKIVHSQYHVGGPDSNIPLKQAQVILNAYVTTADEVNGYTSNYAFMDTDMVHGSLRPELDVEHFPGQDCCECDGFGVRKCAVTPDNQFHTNYITALDRVKMRVPLYYECVKKADYVGFLKRAADQPLVKSALTVLCGVAIVCGVVYAAGKVPARKESNRRSRKQKTKKSSSAANFYDAAPADLYDDDDSKYDYDDDYDDYSQKKKLGRGRSRYNEWEHEEQRTSGRTFTKSINPNEISLLKQKNYVKESVLKAKPLNVDNVRDRVYQIFVDDEFASDATHVGNKLITVAHIFDQKPTKIEARLGAIRYVLKDYVSVAEDLVMFDFDQTTSCPRIPLRIPTAYEYATLVTRREDGKIYTSSGSVMWKGYALYSSDEGDCGAPVISHDDGAVIGFHCAGSTYHNLFVPVNPKIITEVKQGRVSLFSRPPTPHH
jgi:hypothetical protein